MFQLWDELTMVHLLFLSNIFRFRNFSGIRTKNDLNNRVEKESI